MIRIQINNGMEMEVSQDQTRGLINLTTKEENDINRVDGITEGDFVMLMNYYRHIKDNNIQCDFINP